MSSQELPKAIFLMGPTASGKTALAIDLVKHLPCDIISVDSALVYRGLDIGSAKPDAEEQALAPHRLIDICDPAESYSVAEFRRDAMAEMAEIAGAGRIPLLVGGTMLYFKALLEGIAEMPATDPELRKAIVAEAEQRGWPALHEELAAVDPESAARIHPNHSQRIERALSIYRSSGVTMTELHRRQGESEPLPYSILQLAIAPDDRAVLHKRIEQRFHKMMEQGLIDEVRGLKARGDLHLDLPSMRAVGYRQVWEYLDGEVSAEQMLQNGIVATRQLAKRQLTWLRGWSDLCWLHTDESGALLASALPEGCESMAGGPPLDLALHYFQLL